MRCPQCSNRVLYKSGTEHRLRFKGMLVFNDKGLCKGRCYHCNSDIEVPLSLKADAATGMQPEVFVIRRK